MLLRNEEGLKIKAEVFKAMGHPIRLEIIELLRSGELCVCDIVQRVGTGMSNVSKHLSMLKKVGIVGDRRDGLKIMYRLIMPCASDFCRRLEGQGLDDLNRHSEAVAG